MKKLVCIFVALSLLFGNIYIVGAQDPTARNISIFRTYGEHITLSRGDARTTTPRDGQRLSAGNIVTTGIDSTVHIQMDRDSILQMSASSQVAVGTTGNRLVLSLQSGNALVNVTENAPGNTTETRVGNVGLTVRGTMYTMGVQHDRVSLVMLSGSGEVEGVTLGAGQMMFVFDEFRTGAVLFEDETGYFTLNQLLLEELDLFTLQVMYAYQEYLLEVGTLTPDMIEEITSLINDLLQEAEESLYDLPVYVPVTVVVPAPTLQPGPGSVAPVLPTPIPTPAPTPTPTPTPTPNGTEQHVNPAWLPFRVFRNQVSVAGKRKDGVKSGSSLSADD